MTRETKIGMAVAVSFLCLVGIVVATKLHRGADPSKEKEMASKVNPGPTNPPPKGSPGNVHTAAHTETKPNALSAGIKNDSATMQLPILASPNIKMPTPDGSPPLNSVVNNANPPPMPQVPDLPPPPVVNGANPAPALAEDPLKKLQAQIETDRQAALPALPPALQPAIPAASQKQENGLNNVFTKADDEKNNAAAKSNELFFKGVNNVNNQLGKNSNTINQNIDAANRNVDDGINKVNNAATQIAQGATNKGNNLFNQANNQFGKNIDGANNTIVKGLDNLDKNLPPPVPVEAANPSFPSIPPPPAFGNNVAPTPMNLSPAPMVGTNSAFPTLPAPTNPPLPTKIETPTAVIPTPDKNPSPSLIASNNNNSGFTIPAPPKANDAKVINYDVQSYQARNGDTFTNLSKTAYGSEAYANALLAYNRDYSSNRNLTALQPGQTVLLPPAQILKDHYATALADTRPTIPSPSVSINPPVPVNPAGGFVTPTPTTDATKNYRVAAQGQMLYEVAVQTLGDGARWTEIYRLNPNLQPLQPIPGGTVVRLPGNANVP